MATQSGRNGTDLIARLGSEPFRFRFFQAIRILKLAERASGRIASIPWGLRFRTPLTLSFAPSEVTRYGEVRGQKDAASPHQEMEVSFLGLTGPSGILPHHYTELLMERKLTHRDATAHAFLDIFNHRAISLFYEAWQKYRFYVGYEMGMQDGFSQHLLDLLGTGRPVASDSRRNPFSTKLLAYFSGVLGRRPLPSSCLTGIISTYFGVKVVLEQFVGQWIEASAEEQSSLGAHCNALGVSTVLGQRAWDQRTKVRLRIGPLDQATFSAFQPGRPTANCLRQLVETCLGQSLNCDVTLVLQKTAVPEAVLHRDAPVPMSLGINAWVRTWPLEADPDDVRFKLI